MAIVRRFALGLVRANAAKGSVKTRRTADSARSSLHSTSARNEQNTWPRIAVRGHDSGVPPAGV